jgi:hypothetical protein
MSAIRLAAAPLPGLSTGNTLELRLVGSDQEPWHAARVELTDGAGRSFAVTVDEGLPMHLCGLLQGRQCVLLYLRDERWIGVRGGEWELRRQ